MTLRKIIAVLFALGYCLTAAAAVVEGVVADRTTREPLIGATVLVEGTTKGTTTDAQGHFGLDLPEGNHTLVVSYISYVSCRLEVTGGQTGLEILLAPDTQTLSAVKVTGRRNLESERSLQTERIASNVAIENMGAREMSLKGISNVQEGVRKISGISVADAGQLIVRGLGDRYSISRSPRPTPTTNSFHSTYSPLRQSRTSP